MALAVCVQLANAAPSKPDVFPLSRVIGQPESAVNKVLGNPDKYHKLQPNEGFEDFPGAIQVMYPDRPTWVALNTVFYRSKLVFIEFDFEPKPMSEEEFFAALGLSKANFTVTDSVSRPRAGIGATQYRGTINKHLIEIVAWRPSDRDGPGFCELVTIELVHGGVSGQSFGSGEDLGVSAQEIQSVLEREPFRVVFEASTPVNGEPRLMGKTKNGRAIIELIGPATGLTKVDCLLGSDSTRTAIQNAAILLALLKKTLPTWNDSANWLNAGLREVRKTGEVRTRFRHAEIRLTYLKDLGLVTLSVSSSSSSASLENGESLSGAPAPEFATFGRPSDSKDSLNTLRRFYGPSDLPVISP
jgi:hypothetical protein